MAEEYLRNEISKKRPPQTEGKFNELVDHFTKLKEHEHSKMQKIIEGYTSESIPAKEPVMIQFPRKQDKTITAESSKVTVEERIPNQAECRH